MLPLSVLRRAALLLLPFALLGSSPAAAQEAVVIPGGAPAASSHTSPSATGSRALVVLNDADSSSSYSALFSALREKGYDLSIRSASSSTPPLSSHELNNFDHLLYFASTSAPAPGGGSDLAPQRVVEFLKRGGNVVFGFDGQIAEGNRDFAREFHLEFEERGTGVIDHFRAEKSKDQGNHTVVLVGGSKGAAGKLSPGQVVPNAQIFSPQTLAALQASPILYRGLAHRLGALPLAFPLLQAPATACSAEGPSATRKQAEPLEEVADLLTGGEAANLVSAFQVKENSARVLFSGSLDLFKDDFVRAKNLQAMDGSKYDSTGNFAFITDALGWTMQEHSVLHVASTGHHRVRSGPTDVRPEYEEDENAQSMYRVKDIVNFHIDLSQYAPNGGWQPAPKDLDLQVSLVMLDPYVTTKLSAEAPTSVLSSGQAQTNATTRYSATFRLPDRHGVFTFHVDWKRQGWSYVKTRDTAPVRPFNHDEHPRFLSAAYPYVGGAFSTMTAFLLFTTLWLLVKEPQTKQKTQ